MEWKTKTRTSFPGGALPPLQLRRKAKKCTRRAPGPELKYESLLTTTRQHKSKLKLPRLFGGQEFRNEHAKECGLGG